MSSPGLTPAGIGIGLGVYLGMNGGNGYTITLDSEGLLFRDQFNRANAGVLGNGWNENDASFQILNNQVYDDQAVWSNGYTRQDTAAPAAKRGFVVQCNVNPDATGYFTGISAIADGSADTSIYAGVGDVNDYEVTRIVAGSSTNTDADSTITVVAGSWYTVRLAIVANGSNLDASVWGAAALASSDELSNNLTKYAEILNVAEPTDSRKCGFTKWQVGTWDEFFVCGNESGGAITVTGVPTGYKIQIDSQTAVTESGGTVTIPLSTWAAYALPATTIKLLTDGDVVVGQLSPPAGVWGGQTYSVS
jgi:hypothetical protein